mgnify:CR=1 FL=1|tara:strand:- start:4909 stop:5376 length:468 start_codon:yes stop_codon:yes gene_type:complete
MKENIKPVGYVEIEIIKADGSKHQEGFNTISSGIKNKVADSLRAASTNFGLLESAFDNDDFSSPPTNESGIYIEDTGSSKYQMKTTLQSSSDLSFVIKGVARASQSYTIDKAYLGNQYSSGNFTYEYSVYDFNPNVSLSDGDQLNVTWTITIADN